MIKPDEKVRIKSTGRTVKVVGSLWNHRLQEREYLVTVKAHLAYKWVCESDLEAL
jgi:hypothetical protein